ncbi:multi-sensor signal transduction histidine kinase [Candidatus Koribacter versatilis Ellin345]|uniref:histidine kinase n=1 Tax=Koribacter versatilis (strain Ellin345) TaxID=204669 RepID=Q1IRV5_KORVE|nr:multi-sensor signal transduction histidine kinase [Candidatus Koribacter versatilis Ellin345]
MAAPEPIRPPDTRRKRTIIAIVLAVLIFVLFTIIFSQAAFNLTFLHPDTSQQTLIFAALSALIFLLFVALVFVLLRNLVKLYFDSQSRVFGSRFRTKMVLGALGISLGPVIIMFIFAYGLMNRSIDRWFSKPIEEVRARAEGVASLLANYAIANANAEALSIAEGVEVDKAYQTGNFSKVVEEMRRHEATLQGGFSVALQDDNAEAEFHAPQPWRQLRAQTPGILAPQPPDHPHSIQIGQRDFMVGVAPIGKNGRILVAIPLPANYSQQLKDIEFSQQQYWELHQQRKLIRRTYMGFLLLLTALVLFASTWVAFYLSKLVTRPLVALAEATREMAMGRLDYRVDVAAQDELGELVKSFNSMAAQMESSREKIDASTRELAMANVEIEERRRYLETILETIPTGVLSLDAQRHVTRVNTAFRRLARLSEGYTANPGTTLTDIFPEDVVHDLEHMLRRADRMGTTTSQMEVSTPRVQLNVAMTVSSLDPRPRNSAFRLGYVIVVEDLSDLLKAQKQAAWREVARRVAHEIKNPLTPIALAAERIRRHLDRGLQPDANSLAVIHSCSDTIASSVETLRNLVDQFSALARFPASQPQASDINEVVQSALLMFEGRLEGIRVTTFLAPDLPKVMADPAAVKRAVANLVDNAAEALNSSMLREIQIATNLTGSRDMVEIVVADTGHGVTSEVKEKLFLPYFSTKQRGTGLGLAIVSRIIEDHHGTIRVEENSPVGTRFIVELPVAPESAIATAAEHAQHSDR